MTDQRTALVTGSSKGIGAAIVQRLAAEGYQTFVTYHSDEAGGREIVDAIRGKGGIAHLAHLDVTSETSVAGLAQRITEDAGRLDVLVSNAVTERAKPIEEATYDEWSLVTDTKINGAFLSIKHHLPLLRAAGRANLIFITSADGERPQPDYLAYCVGTAGLIAMAKALAISLPKYGIRVNCVSPGPTRTPLWDALGGDDETMWEGFAKDNPFGRIATTADVAAACLMLINDETNFLNGNTVYVNGGSHLK